MRNDPALAPARIFIQPNEERFKDTYRRWQGIPSIEVTSHGRIFVNFYSGQDAEVGGNIMIPVSYTHLDVYKRQRPYHILSHLRQSIGHTVY